jgi:hypothetical protein
MSVMQSDLQREIERMEVEVKRQEESGQFNTASHEVLANLKRAAQDKPVETISKKDKE